MEKAETALLLVSVLGVILLGLLLGALARADRLEVERATAVARADGAWAEARRNRAAFDSALADTWAIEAERNAALKALAALKADLLRLAQAEPPAKAHPEPTAQAVTGTQVVSWAGVTLTPVVQPLGWTTCFPDPFAAHGPVWVTGTVSCLPTGVTVAPEDTR